MTTSTVRTTGRRPTIPPRTPGPDPARLAAILARTWLEVRAGQRPFEQVAAHTSPAARRRLAVQLEAGRDHHADGRARIRRVIASEPASGVCEACVLVECGGRTTAVAVRMERHRGVWRAVDLAPPEAGLAPLATASLPEDTPERDAFDEVADETDDAACRSAPAPPVPRPTRRGSA